MIYYIYVCGNLYCVLVDYANVYSCRGSSTFRWTCCFLVQCGR